MPSLCYDGPDITVFWLATDDSLLAKIQLYKVVAVSLVFVFLQSKHFVLRSNKAEHAHGAKMFLSQSPFPRSFSFPASVTGMLSP